MWQLNPDLSFVYKKETKMYTKTQVKGAKMSVEPLVEYLHLNLRERWQVGQMELATKASVILSMFSYVEMMSSTMMGNVYISLGVSCDDDVAH